MHLAASYGLADAKVVKLLSSRQDIDVHRKDRVRGGTPLHHASGDDRAEVVKLFLSLKDITRVNSKEGKCGGTDMNIEMPLVLSNKDSLFIVIPCCPRAFGRRATLENIGFCPPLDKASLSAGWSVCLLPIPS